VKLHYTKPTGNRGHIEKCESGTLDFDNGEQIVVKPGDEKSIYLSTVNDKKIACVASSDDKAIEYFRNCKDI
jgi:hypothetical protein